MGVDARERTLLRVTAAGGEEMSLFIPFLYFKGGMVRIWRYFATASKSPAERIAQPPFGLIIANLIWLSH